MVEKKNKPLPFVVYFSFFALMALVGLIDAIYLSVSHYSVYTDIDHRSFCAISQAINCDTVSQSPYSIFLRVPIPVWGVLGYVGVLVLLIGAWRHRNAARRLFWPSLFIVALAYSVNSLILAVISAMVIRSHCIMCILSHAVNFGMLFCSWLIYRRFEQGSILMGLVHDVRHLRSHWRMWGAGLAVFFGLAVAMVCFFPAYWEIKLTVPGVDLKRGVTSDGHPWIGAEDPEYEIVEFSDYQCFQCKKMHFFLRQLVAQHHWRLRLIHRHFPMDHEYNAMVDEPFHPGAGKMAMIALYAKEKGQFWEVNDLLFELAGKKEDFNTRMVAEEMGITSGELAAALDSKYLRLRLKHDIAVGIVEGIRGTPGYIIDGNVYTGTIPKDILQKMMSENGK